MPVTPGALPSSQAPSKVPSTAPRPAGLYRSPALRAGALLVISAAAAVGASSQLFPGPPSSREPVAVTTPEVRAVPPAEAAAFAILRRPLRSTDAFAALHAGSGPLGANPTLARTLSEPKGGLSAGAVSVVPANGSVCLRVPFAKGGAQWWCQTLALARMGNLVIALRPSGPLRASEQLVVGLVPDGVPAVTVTVAGGERRSVPVRSNVYDAQVYAPRSLSFDLPGHGTRSYPAP
jgi:hypothetical protein